MMATELSPQRYARRMIALRSLAPALFCALLAGCSDSEESAGAKPGSQIPSPTELQQRGPHAVGFRSLELTYRPLASASDRKLPLRIWYPAVDGGESKAEYAVAGIVAVPTDGALADPKVIDASPFPVAVYSHGSGGEGLLAYPYAEHFASHGWVVIAPNHVGNTAVDAVAQTSDPLGRIALNRPQDITAVVDWAAALAGDELSGKMATDKVFLFGHSFGAYTTLTSGGVTLDYEALKSGCGGSAVECEIFNDADAEAAFKAGFKEPRIVAIAPQAPALVPNFTPGSLAALDVPTLLMSGRKDITTTDAEQARPAWEGLDHPGDLWVDLPLGGHLTFISICDDLSDSLIKSFQPSADEDGCGPDFTPVSQAIPVLTTYLLGFAQEQVLGEAKWRALLAGPPLDPIVETTAR